MRKQQRDQKIGKVQRRRTEERHSKQVVNMHNMPQSLQHFIYKFYKHLSNEYNTFVHSINPLTESTEYM